MNRDKSRRLTTTQASFTKQVTGFGDLEQLPDCKVVPGGTLTAEAALSIYQRAYVARLTEALGETFEAVWRVLGDDDFFRTTRSFIEVERSQSYNLSDYGLSFPEFLEQKHGAEFPFLSSLARFEWSFKNVFHAKQHEPIAPSRLVELDLNEDIRLIIGSAVQLFEAPFSVYELWKQRAATKISLLSLDLAKPEAMVLYKKEQKIFAKVLSRTEFRILSSLTSGETLASALSRGDSQINSASVTNLFQIIFEAGLIADIQSR